MAEEQTVSQKCKAYHYVITDTFVRDWDIQKNLVGKHKYLELRPMANKMQ